MPKVILLQNIVDALESQSENSETYLDRETGDIIRITEDDRYELENDNPNEVPDWQREHLTKIRELLGTERLISLPSLYDIHEWSIMEQFCNTVANEQARQQLFDAIHGTGAFRMFRNTLDQFDLEEEWHTYRHSAFEEIARDWLDANNISFE